MAVIVRFRKLLFAAVVTDRCDGDRRRQPGRRVLASEFPALVEPVPRAARVAHRRPMRQRVAAYAPEVLGGLQAQPRGEQGKQRFVWRTVLRHWYHPGPEDSARPGQKDGYGWAMFAEIDAACAAFAREENIPGLVAGVVTGGVLAQVTTLGLADFEAKRPVGRDTVFRIASMTKNMTALA